MKNLQLPLIYQWFALTRKGIKGEDYRYITPNYCSKFLLFNGKKMSREFWRNIMNATGDGFIDYIKENTTFVIFDVNVMTLGYPRKDDESRILRYKHAGIMIDTGNQEWGAEDGVLYFVIKHGERIIVD